MSILGKISGLEKDTFGLDIGYENLKVVQLKKAGLRFKLAGFGSTPSPKEPFSKNTISDKKTLAEAIKKATSEYKITARAAISALPESLVFTKIIQLPEMKPKELASTVPLEAASFIPLEPAQTYLDFQVVGEIKGNLEILVVATPKTLVDDFIEALKLAGFSLICLETKPLANTRALIKTNEKQGILILDLGAETTSLAIFDQGAIKFTATLKIGGNLFTRAIARNLTVKLEQAEEIKKKTGLSKIKDAGKIKAALETPLNSLVDEVAKSLKFYRSKKEVEISKIILAGGGAVMPGLSKFLQDKIGLKTELGNPWSKIANHPEPRETLQFTTAIGLAMREI